MNHPDQEYSPTRAKSSYTISSDGVSLLYSFGSSITFFVTKLVLNYAGLSNFSNQVLKSASSFLKIPSPAENTTLANWPLNAG